MKKLTTLPLIGAILILGLTACQNWEDQCRAEGNIPYQGQCIDRDEMDDFEGDDNDRRSYERFEEDDEWDD
jgi:hypothetical protein